MVGGPGAAVAALTEVGGARDLHELGVFRLVRVVAAVAVLVSQAGTGQVLRPPGVEDVGSGGRDGAVVAAEAEWLEAGKLGAGARLARPEQFTIVLPRQVAVDAG